MAITLVSPLAMEALCSVRYNRECLRWRMNRCKARLNSARESPLPLVFRTVHATFAAHGSSMDWTLVMSTSPLGECTLSTVYPVVPVAMDCRSVDGLVVMTISIEVMEVDKCLGQEAKSTCLALASVLFEPRSQAARDPGRGSATARPLPPIALVRTRRSPNFGLPYTRDAGMLIPGESSTFTAHPTLSWLNGPRAVADPVAGFSGRSVSGPLVELDRELMVEFLAHLFADHSARGVAPAGNLWIQPSTEVFLLRRLVVANGLGQRLAMTFDGVCTRFDQGLEASSRSRVALPHSILTNRDSQEVEADSAFFVEQRVGNSGFLGVECKTDALEPFLREVLTGRDGGSVPVNHHQVVGLSDDLGFPVGQGGLCIGVQADLLWKVRAHMGFESVERAVCETR